MSLRVIKTRTGVTVRHHPHPRPSDTLNMRLSETEMLRLFVLLAPLVKSITDREGLK